MSGFQDSVQSIGSNAVALGSNGYQGRSQISIYNPGGGIIFVGGAAVASNSGYAIASNATQTFNTPQGEAIYAVSDKTIGTTLVRILEF